MSLDKHKVTKMVRNRDIKKILSDYMKSMGYQALIGSGGDIAMRFIGSNGSTACVERVEFEVQDANNPESEAVYIKKAEAIAIIAKAKKIDLKTHDINID